MNIDRHDDKTTAPSDDITTGAGLHGLLEEVERAHGHEGASAMSDHLRNRMAETSETLDIEAGMDY